MTPKTAAVVTVGTATLMYWLHKWFQPVDPGKATPVLILDPVSVLSSARPLPTPSLGPRQLPPGPISVVPGSLYRATVNVSFPLSIAASVSKAQTQAQSMGFQGVSVSTSMPSGWPGAKGDYYVTGTYGGAPKTLDRSAAAGQVSVIDAWQG